jgi:hypothetical protein
MELLQSLTAHDFTKMVWRKGAKESFHKLCTRFDTVLKSLRDAARAELKECLGLMLNDCQTPSQHTNCFFVAVINTCEEKVSDK